MNAKQALIDILVALVIPALLISGYYIFLKSDDGGSLLSDLAPQWAVRPDASHKNIGEKVKNQLRDLDAITLDSSVFSDEAFVTLKEYPVIIATSSLGRDYPFTRPYELERAINKTKQTKENKAETNMSAKINKLKNAVLQ